MKATPTGATLAKTSGVVFSEVPHAECGLSSSLEAPLG